MCVQETGDADDVVGTVLGLMSSGGPLGSPESPESPGSPQSPQSPESPDGLSSDEEDDYDDDDFEDSKLQGAEHENMSRTSSGRRGSLGYAAEVGQPGDSAADNMDDPAAADESLVDLEPAPVARSRRGSVTSGLSEVDSGTTQPVRSRRSSVTALMSEVDQTATSPSADRELELEHLEAAQHSFGALESPSGEEGLLSGEGGDDETTDGNVVEGSVAWGNGWRGELDEGSGEYYYYQIDAPGSTQCWELPTEVHESGAALDQTLVLNSPDVLEPAATPTRRKRRSSIFESPNINGEQQPAAHHEQELGYIELDTLGRNKDAAPSGNQQTSPAPSSPTASSPTPSTRVQYFADSPEQQKQIDIQDKRQRALEPRSPKIKQRRSPQPKMSAIDVFEQRMVLTEKHKISNDEFDQYRSDYNSIDGDGSGLIEIDEVAKLLRVKTFCDTSQQAMALFDVDNDGVVTLEEYVAAVCRTLPEPELAPVPGKCPAHLYSSESYSTAFNNSHELSCELQRLQWLKGQSGAALVIVGPL